MSYKDELLFRLKQYEEAYLRLELLKNGFEVKGKDAQKDIEQAIKLQEQTKKGIKKVKSLLEKVKND